MKDTPRFEIVTEQHIIKIIPVNGMLATSYPLAHAIMKQLLTSATENDIKISKVFK